MEKKEYPRTLSPSHQMALSLSMHLVDLANWALQLCQMQSCKANMVTANQQAQPVEREESRLLHSSFSQLDDSKQASQVGERERETK